MIYLFVDGCFIALTEKYNILTYPIFSEIKDYYRRKASRRVLYGILWFYILKSVLGSLFYYLFGFGILTVIYMICTGKSAQLLLMISELMIDF